MTSRTGQILAMMQKWTPGVWVYLLMRCSQGGHHIDTRMKLTLSKQYRQLRYLFLDTYLLLLVTGFCMLWFSIRPSAHLWLSCCLTLGSPPTLGHNQLAVTVAALHRKAPPSCQFQTTEHSLHGTARCTSYDSLPHAKMSSNCHCIMYCMHA